MKRSKHLVIVGYFAMLILLNLFVVNIAFVSGTSMEPTLSQGTVLVVRKWNVSPQTGDIVITTAKNPFSTPLIKRVVASPGQHLEIASGTLSVDGVPEAYYQGIVTTAPVNMTIPTDAYYLVGDNFQASRDSREIGVISKKEIQGIVIFP